MMAPFKFNVPMFLTWMRIILIPFVIGIFYIPNSVVSLHECNVLATVIFLIAAITDALDGFLARRYAGWATDMGAFLDPVADKLLVSAALLALVGLDRCDMLVALVIIGREITVSALREWMAKIGASGAVKVNWLGKLKTIFQMIAIPLLLWWDSFSFHTEVFWGEVNIAFIGQSLLTMAAILTIYSMVVYLKGAREAIKNETN